MGLESSFAGYFDTLHLKKMDGNLANLRLQNITSGAITPLANNTYDLGTALIAWHDIFSSYGHIGDLTVPSVVRTDTIYGYTDTDLTIDPYGSKKTKVVGNLEVSGSLNPLLDTDAYNYSSSLAISASTWTDLASVTRTLSNAKIALIMAHAYVYTASYAVGASWEGRILVDGSEVVGSYQRMHETGYLTSISTSAIVSLSAAAHTIKLQGWSSYAGTVYDRRIDVMYI
jgi:hypothetical protein